MLGNFKTYQINMVGNKLNKLTQKFIADNHYSGTARSQLPKYIFELVNSETGQVIGIALYGIPCGKNVRSKYGKNCVELRRLVVLDGAIKNTTSWFLSRTIQYLKKHTFVSGIVSYSDPNVGHNGHIYLATNFKYLGKELGNNPRIYKLGKKKVHQRMVYQKTNGRYVNSALHYQYLLKMGKLKKVKQLPKDRFFYELSNNKAKVI